jgi:hypothetical protein
MFFRLRIAAVAALFQGLFVSGIEFSGPTATPVAQNHDFDADGWTPKPTSGPKPVMELFRRQDEDPSFCGYAEGDPGMALFLRFYLAIFAVFYFQNLFIYFSRFRGIRLTAPIPTMISN